LLTESSDLPPEAGPLTGGPAAPRVSVLVRSLDRPLLQQALDSVAMQTQADIEVVVVAVHPGHAPLPAHCGPFPLRLIAAAEARPRSVAANTAIAHARGDLLLFLDDDDWLMPEHIGRLVQALQAHPRALAAYAGVATVDAAGQPLGQVFDLPFDAVRQLSGNLMPIHAVLFRRSLVEQGCRFDETLDRYEDWDFWVQMARLTVPVHVPGVSAVYRIHDSSGVHDDAGVDSRSSQRIQHKWLQRSSPQELGALMKRVWDHDVLAQRLDDTRHAAALDAQALAESRQQALRWEAELGRQALTLSKVEQVQAQLLQQTVIQAQALTALQASLERQQLSMLEQVQQDRAELARLHELQRQHLLEQRDTAERALLAMQASSSWRLTAPLRGLVDVVRRGGLRLRSGGWSTRLKLGVERAQRFHRQHGWRATLRRAVQGPRVLPAAGMPASGLVTEAGGSAHAPGRAAGQPAWSFYRAKAYGQRRVTLVVHGLDRAEDLVQAGAALSAAVTRCATGGARLRVVGTQRAIAGPQLDAWLRDRGLVLNLDPQLLPLAERADLHGEIDRFDEEMVLAAAPDLLTVCRASVPASCLLLVPPEPVDPSLTLSNATDSPGTPGEVTGDRTLHRTQSDDGNVVRQAGSMAGAAR
jgi:hypothetical protein